MPDSSTYLAVRRAIGVGSLGFGVAGLLAPGRLAGVYGLEFGPEATFMAREWGSRNLALGCLGLAASTPQERRRVDAISAVHNTVDAVVTAASSSLPTGFRVRAALTSAAVAAAGVWLTRQAD